MIYKIDDEDINDRISWVAQYRPSDTRGAQHQFPGIGHVFFVDPPALAPDLAVQGYLEGETPDAVRAIERTYIAMMTDGVLHKVQIGNTIHPQAKLQNFQAIGDKQALAGVGAQQKVQFTWRFSTPATEAAEEVAP